MSGLPALRCFIFFAADLFILFLPSFRREDPEQMGQRFILTYTALGLLKWANLCVNHGNLVAAHASMCRTAIWDTEPLPGNPVSSGGAIRCSAVLFSCQACRLGLETRQYSRVWREPLQRSPLLMLCLMAAISRRA
jgi:hypothetical protein